ncbi:energy transducer TonB [Microbulbifer sp. 2201CG32-9]|uniref:energy transducer TonB n=1 Tax=Microbulbifer sp. 2201CG32-9 TaxID=3232309 RepID=UPI00345C293F
MKIRIITLIFILFFTGCSTIEVLLVKDAPSFKNEVALGSPVNEPPRKYPKNMLEAGQEGWVILKVDIDETGVPNNIRAVDCSPYRDFVKAAKYNVRGSIFAPHIVNGQAVYLKDYILVTSFKLSEEWLKEVKQQRQRKKYAGWTSQNSLGRC